ncbi:MULTISPECIES: serine hydrolase [Alcaligenes]|uniref:serine-type D-Ala-D-Ala carboxypeptidase n=1 Tax=Alcaligenes aquatilis TaxID=323284 RepID=A0ABY4NGS1_9BURK|nr:MULTISPECIES: serine hydrolase [Alcaligenes]MCC9164882.1 serine hydrolase [Alcaligenes sp. MMA]QXR36198.1 serine hydrolase [Alcaligenes aquatilis]UQN36280.1 serine hydrolase [Alcaligenes aquatilis]UYY87550.1 serine hydrolase [Alcaligenes sp. SMD-FA]
MTSIQKFASPVLSRCVVALALALPMAVQAQAQTPTPTESAQVLGAPTPALPGDLSVVPAPALTARAWLSMDVNSGQIIAAEGLNEQVEPASLTKLMTAYLVFDALESGRLKLDQTVVISEKAWRTEGSRMFVKVNSQVSVNDLLQGVIVQSGNDASVALAEAVAGSEEAFAALMNEEAAKLGLTATHFKNSTGLPDPDHLTSVRDLGMLSAALVARFPQYLHYYSQKEYTYNNIKQPNRNRLLWLDNTVDGLKTGHTQSAGYCLVSTALRDGRRVVSVVVGTANDAARTENSLKLLNWSFQNFETVKLYDTSNPAVTARVWEGEVENVGLGTAQPLWLTVPRGKSSEIKPVANYTQPLLAPLSKGDKVGTLTLSLDGKVLAEQPLLVLQDVPEAGFFGRMADKVRLMFE